jgi:hypothetical protein
MKMPAAMNEDEADNTCAMHTTIRHPDESEDPGYNALVLVALGPDFRQDDGPVVIGAFHLNGWAVCRPRSIGKTQKGRRSLDALSRIPNQPRA